MALVALVIFQGLLGMWTVTLLLKPIVVVGTCSAASRRSRCWSRLAGGARRSSREPTPGLRVLGVAAAAALVLQISLGGWTSANYAALACPDFPTCQTQWWPAIADFEEGFVLWRGLGIDYEGGVLDHPARVAVHFTHRLGAVASSRARSRCSAWRLMREPATRPDGTAVLAVLLLQLSLGVSIVWFGVPLAVAVLHNGVAALLLLTVIEC